MKRVNDDPYYPDFSDLDAIIARGKLKRRAEPTTVELREVKQAAEALAQFRLHAKRSAVMRKSSGRPYEGPGESFHAFILVNNEMNVYRDTFGVKRVPETETKKFIDYARRRHPNVSEETIRRHLRNDRWMLPSTAKSKT